MNVEYWSREEIEEYCENPNLLIAHANEMRSRMIWDFFVRLTNRITSIIK